MRPMYCFHLWQQMQIKEASEDMDVISRNAWIQDDIIMAGLWYWLLYQTDDELSGFTQNVIKPQLAPRERIIFIWSGFPNPDASFNLVHTVVSMGVWHAKVPLSRIQNIQYRSSGEAVLEPYLTSDPPGADGKEKRCSMRDSVEHKKTVWGNLWVISVPHTRQRVRKHSE